MVQQIPPPDCRNLLPPLLACLPTSFVSPRPPPALIPLLSPILRQRVQLLAVGWPSTSKSWLPLLCWETEPANKLVDVISESDAFELHPVSGEIDFGDVQQIKYRRLDEETLQAKVVVTDLGLVIIYLWCEEDQEGGGNGWRVSEVRPLESEAHNASTNWLSSVAEADDNAREKMMDDALRHGEDHTIPQIATIRENGIDNGKIDNDDDYWARYDSTPGRTPAAKRSPGPTANLSERAKSTSENDYYEQYTQVQPELDNDGPATNGERNGNSTLNGDVMTAPLRHHLEFGNGNNFQPSATDPAEPHVSHPTASSPTDGSAAISRLEDSAASQSSAESGIRQHFSTSIKSLFRLARSSGIDRAEFDRMIRTELDTLSMIEEDD